MLKIEFVEENGSRVSVQWDSANNLDIENVFEQTRKILGDHDSREVLVDVR